MVRACVRLVAPHVSVLRSWLTASRWLAGLLHLFASSVVGVLADELDRKVLLARMQLVQCAVLLGVWAAEVAGLLQPWHVYVAMMALTGARRLEGSAR
eukprot:COSAG01_NODE_10869_length_2065_cov_6.878942_1_plen_98_part_00